MKGDFSADVSNKKWLTDITQSPCKDGKLYIAPIMDCFGGEIIALAMDDNMKKEKLYRIDTTNLKMEEVKKIVRRFVVYYNRCRITTMNPNGYPPAIYRQMFEDGLVKSAGAYPKICVNG